METYGVFNLPASIIWLIMIISLTTMVISWVLMHHYAESKQTATKLLVAGYIFFFIALFTLAVVLVSWWTIANMWWVYTGLWVGFASFVLGFIWICGPLVAKGTKESENSEDKDDSEDSARP